MCIHGQRVVWQKDIHYSHPRQKHVIQRLRLAQLYGIPRCPSQTRRCVMCHASPRMTWSVLVCKQRGSVKGLACSPKGTQLYVQVTMKQNLSGCQEHTYSHRLCAKAMMCIFEVPGPYLQALLKPGEHGNRFEGTYRMKHVRVGNERCVENG